MKPKIEVREKFGLREKIKDVSQLYQGQHVRFKDKYGIESIGSIKIKAVRCGKPNCHKCPHKIYAYAQYRSGKKVIEKYIGVAR